MEKQSFHSIKWRFLIICIFLISVPAVLLGILSYDTFRREVYSNAEEQLKTIVKGWYAMTETYIQERDRVLKREEFLVEKRLESIALDVKALIELFEDNAGDAAVYGKLRRGVLGRIEKIRIGRSGYAFVLDEERDYVAGRDDRVRGKNFFSDLGEEERVFFSGVFDDVMKREPGDTLAVNRAWGDPGYSRPRKKLAVFARTGSGRYIVGAVSYHTDYKSSDLGRKLREELSYKMAEQRIGKDGYLWVINSEGEYIVSKDMYRNGENIFDEQDSSGRFIVREIIEETKKMPPGSVYISYYDWKNIGEEKAALKAAATTYVPELDYIIGAGLYNRDFLGGLSIIRRDIFIVVITFIVVGAFIAYLFALFVSSPINRLEEICLKAAQGDLDIEIGGDLLGRRDETGSLARSFSKMIRNIKEGLSLLRESDRRFQDVVDNAREWVWEIDGLGKFIYSSPLVVQILGYSPRELRGRSIRDLVFSEDREDFDRASEIIFTDRKPFNELTIRAVKKNGEPAWLFCAGVPVFDNDEAVAGCRGIAFDITERRRAEEALAEHTGKIEEINRELDDFTYIVSHDLKEPLRSIDAFSKFLDDDCRDKMTDEEKNYLGRIRANVTRMRELIDDLLEISRIERRKNQFEEVGMDRIVDEVRERLGYALNDKPARLIANGKLPVISCDRVRMTEVVANLVSNAIKYGDKEETVIEVGADRKNGFYEFYVRDNGPGIEEQYFEKIFGIFQRLVKKEEQEGTGAGLAIVKKIVEMHKGKIRVESELGRGTTFYFTVPLQPAEKGMLARQA